MTVGIAAGTLNSWIDAYCRNVAYSQPAQFWVKLHIGDPGSAGTNNAAANTTRQQATFAAASGGANATSADLTWTSVPNTETYSHVSFWTANAAGTFLGSDDLTSSRAVTVGDTFVIPSGTLTVAIAPVAA